MNILLINPPRSPYNAILEYAPVEAKKYIHKKLIGPPLGLLTIAGALDDHDVRVLETKAEYDLNPAAPALSDLVRQELADFKPHLVGLTVITSEFNASCLIASVVKSVDPAILTVAGGLHPTLCPEDFNHSSFDVLCKGHSAGTFRSLVAASEKQTPFSSIPDIYINADGVFRFTYNKREPVNPAGENFILPRRDLIKKWIDSYYVGTGNGPVTYLFSSLGCPYRCTFCSIWPQMAGAYFQRTITSLIEELRTLDEYTVVRFADANTIVDVDFISRLFDAIATAGLKKEYVMDLRADTIVKNPALIGKLARMGLKVVICGFEFISDQSLDKYNKASGEKLIKEAITILQDNGILIRGNYIVRPDFTQKDFDALTAYTEKHRITFAGYTILTPFPGTSLYAELEPEIIDTNYDRYNMFNCVLKTQLPRDEFYRKIGALWMIKKGEDVL